MREGLSIVCVAELMPRKLVYLSYWVTVMVTLKECLGCKLLIYWPRCFSLGGINSHSYLTARSHNKFDLGVSMSWKRCSLALLLG